MVKYTVVITASVQKMLAKLPDAIANKLETAMLALEYNPRPHGYKKLKGRVANRIRVGDYRIIYEVEDFILKVTVIDAGHRKEIYR